MASQEPLSDLHEAARAWAQAGFYVFPCAEGQKEPAVKGGAGMNEATTDLDQIDAWWTDNPNYNIGIAPERSAMFVLDCDGPLGVEALSDVVAMHSPLPDTLTIQTPRGVGHTHQWFLGNVPSTVSKIAAKVDTRGVGGYVLVPPSIVNGVEYTYVGETDEIAQAPAWIADTIAELHSHHEAAEGVILDLPANLDRAKTLLRDYVSRGEVAVEGSGGDHKTYAVAAEILSLGLSEAKAFELMRDEFNPNCIPPWTEEEIATKVHNAANYSQNEAGAYAAPDAAAVFGGMIGISEDVTKIRSRFTPLELSDIKAFEPPEWIVPGLIPKRGTVQIIGKQKSFKTFLVLDLALGIAAGVETFGHTPEPLPVIYIAGENASAMVLNHIPSWRMAREYQGDLPFYVVPNMPQAQYANEMQELVAEVRRLGIQPGVIVIDTATRALRGLDENSARDMGLFSAACEYLQRELSCTVIVIRHTGKDKDRGARGSNVIEGDFDTILHVERHEKTLNVKLIVAEQRNAAEREEPYTFVGRPFGQSLAFFQTDRGSYDAATREDDPFDRLKIGAALRDLGALGGAKGVTTHVIAAHITPQGTLTAEQHQEQLARVVTALNKAAKGRLVGYVEGEGRSLKWCLPALSD